jgi:hypothetical protein
MSTPVPLRSDFDAIGLRVLARRSRDPDQTRRLLALAEIYDGGSAGRGRWADSRPAWRRALAADRSGAVALEEFRVSISKSTLSRELRHMGFRKLSARPRHHAQDSRGGF